MINTKKTNVALIAAILFFTLANANTVFAEGLPGRLEGSGTHFEIIDSTYLNVTLDSSEQIKIMLESVPEMVVMYIEPISEAPSTIITLGGFTPLTTYYKYEDNYHNLVEITTDETGSYTYTQDLSKAHLIFIQTGKSTIFLSDTGWDDGEGNDPEVGTWDQVTLTGTLTTDVTEAIGIDSDGITLDGDGHTITGSGYGAGIWLPGRTGVTVKKVDIENFSFAIELSPYDSNTANSNTLTDNTISNNIYGIRLHPNCNNNTITGNTIRSNFYGIEILAATSGNEIYNNNFIDNSVFQAYDYSASNIFNLPEPTGGNYWSDWTSPDADSDGFVDNPYVFTGGQDDLPYTTPNGWSKPSEDTTPPVTTIALSGTLGNNDWYRSDVVVTLSATDDKSGVALTEYGFDGTTWITYSAPFTISDEGTTTVYYRSTDDSGNVEATKSETIKVDKTDPTITIKTPTPYELYTVGVALDFWANDSMSGVVPESVVGTLTKTDVKPQEVRSSDPILEPGVYTLVVRAKDNAGNEAESAPVQFVVYDPEGGFATGGGWFYPDGESSLSPEGKANFGFVAKYKKGVSTGNLEFHYKDAEINLKSTTIDWIVISGTSAQFQGTGTINGEGLYTFRIRVKDEGESGAGVDSFDIMIWEGTGTEGELVHKSENVLDGGNIVIHKK